MAVALGKRFKQTRLQLPAALTRIAELFDQNRRHGVGAPAWGQYLDDPLHEQSGLLGTCAAIEVLAHHGGVLAEVATQAAAALPDLDTQTAPTDPSVHDAILAKGDLGITFKVCARAETLLPAGNGQADRHPLFDALVSGRCPGEGWSDHRIQSPLLRTWSPTPTVAATAVALFALRRYEPFVASAAHRESVLWMCAQLGEVRGAPTYELSLALLALHSTSVFDKETGVVRARLKHELGRRLRRNGARGLTPESHEYAAPWGAVRTAADHSATSVLAPGEADRIADPEQRAGIHQLDADPQAASAGPSSGVTYRYMFYLPSVLAACALLFGGRRLPIRSRRAVLRTVATCTDAMVSAGRVVGSGRRWASTVDHMWVYRLLVSYRSARTRDVRPLPILAPAGVLLVVAAICTAGFIAGGWRVLIGSLAGNILVVGIPWVIRRSRS